MQDENERHWKKKWTRIILSRASLLALAKSIYYIRQLCFLKSTFGLKFFTSGFNWIPKISRQPIKFRNCSISTFDRHMKLNTSAKFHDFNQKSYNPCTYQPPRPTIFNFPPSDLMRPCYCRSGEAHMHMQIALLLAALIQERYLLKCDQKRTKPSPGWLSCERRVWWAQGVKGSNPGLTNTQGL